MLVCNQLFELRQGSLLKCSLFTLIYGSPMYHVSFLLYINKLSRWVLLKLHNFKTLKSNTKDDIQENYYMLTVVFSLLYSTYYLS